MVRDPSQFQVIVTCNLFGDIASDLGAGLAGGLGIAPSGNIHPGQISMFEPVHGSAPSLSGRNVANPMGAVLSAAMMFAHLGWPSEGTTIENAVRAAIREEKTTSDLGGEMRTDELGDWICEHITRLGISDPQL
jgi:3-isopropylmalate dehydrogenase